ncbi:cytochrome b [Roseococcus sp. DSY-14]|uniref:cytochrome b n=1 Tax=Roseococcus sp. DSY-14 TaxID=3369650 RepID=UPI00387B3E7C
MGYAPAAKWFHWLTVPLLLGALAFGLVIGHVRDADKMRFYQIHESLGALVFLLTLARLAVRLRHPPPPHPAIPAPMRRAADAVHATLYLALLAQPLLGFIGSNAWGFPMAGATAFLGFIHQPPFMAKNEALGTLLLQLHQWLGWTIAALVALHVAAVVFHQAIRKDGTLLRMV